MQFLNHGFELVDNFISEEWRRQILNDIEMSKLSTDVSGIRHVDAKLKSVKAYLYSAEFRQAASKFLPKGAQLVRAILFNKSAESNWFVTWHQDKTVAVSAKFNEEGWGAWSCKEGVHHVQPPLALLNEMVTVRIHLDPTPKENGCLKVIPNSHKLGILNPSQIAAVISSENHFLCEATKYSALIMRPHLLHASSKSVLPADRRILHVEFSNWQLPDDVEWG